MTRADLTITYARELQKILVKHAAADETQHCLYVEINSGASVQTSTWVVPSNWSECEARITLKEVYPAYNENAPTGELSFVSVVCRAFSARLLADVRDDPRIAETCLVAFHPKGAIDFGAVFAKRSRFTEEAMHAQIHRYLFA